jgi:hypothetical protein
VNNWQNFKKLMNYICFEVDNMPKSVDKSRITKETEKRKKEEKHREQNEEKKKANPIETVTLDILQSKNGEQKIWLSFQDIADGFQNKALFIDYWNKTDEFKKDLSQALSTLEAKGKIEKKIVGQEAYFSSI